MGSIFSFTRVGPRSRLVLGHEPDHVKANLDTLGLCFGSLVPSGFIMFDIDEFNPLQPVLPENRPIIDGGQYVDGVISGASGTIIYDGGFMQTELLSHHFSCSRLSRGT